MTQKNAQSLRTARLRWRIVMGIYVALHRQARLVTFSTGASEIDGVKEAEYTRNFVYEHVDALASLLSKKLNHAFTGKDLREWIEHRSILDLESQNTVEETASNLTLALSRKCKEVIGVTNAFHAPRCLAGLQVARINHDSPLLISVIPAFDDGSDTVIIEAPHRGDMPKVPFNQTAKGIFGFLKNSEIAFEFSDAWATLIADFKEKQIRMEDERQRASAVEGLHPVIPFEGKDYKPTHWRIVELVTGSLEPITVTKYQNAGRSGIQIRAVDPLDGMPRRLFVFDGGEEWGPIDPGSPAYGPDGVDTGC